MKSRLYFNVISYAYIHQLVFCTPDQIKDEVKGVLDLTFDMLNAFGFTKFTISLSTKPDKSVGSEDQWKVAEDSLKDTLDGMKLSYDTDHGGGAFYGPKIEQFIFSKYFL